MLIRSLVLVLVAAGLPCCTKPDDTVTAASAERTPAGAPASAWTSARPAPAGMHRLDFSFTVTDPGKPPTTSAYTINLEEHTMGEIRLGKNVPLAARPPASAPGSPPLPAPTVARQDVGFLLRCRYDMVGDDLLLHSDTEMSSADELPVIHRVALRGDALVAPDRTAVVSSSEDPVTHRRYQLSVAATRLR